MSNDLKIIYSGTFVNAQYIGHILENNGIDHKIVDDFQSSMMAGWSAPGSENSVRVMVNENDIETAIEAIKRSKETS
jgi:hypothetical protein